MIPFILAAVGGYLIGKGTKDKQIFDDGGMMDEEDGNTFDDEDYYDPEDKLDIVKTNISDLVTWLDKNNKMSTIPDEVRKYIINIEKVVGLGFAKGGKTEKKYAKGGSVGVDKASNGFKKKFVWVTEQGGVATEILQQKSFEEAFKEISNNTRFRLAIDDKGLKVFRDDYGWTITFRLRPIFAYGGQLEKTKAKGLTKTGAMRKNSKHRFCWTKEAVKDGISHE